MNRSEETAPDGTDVASEAMPVAGRLRCSICERQFDPDSPDAAMPFCSARCKNVDLGRWLGEGYGLPYEPADDEPDE